MTPAQRVLHQSVSLAQRTTLHEQSAMKFASITVKILTQDLITNSQMFILHVIDNRFARRSQQNALC